jgi:hypothetical protein
MNPHQTKISEEKIDNGDGTFTVNTIWQFTESTTIDTNEIQAQIDTLQAQVADLPVGAMKAVNQEVI